MKTLFILIFFVICISSVDGQTLLLKFDNSKSITRILNSIDLYKTFDIGQINISIILVANESSSANKPGTDEVTHKLYIGVTEGDLYPRRLLYSIDNLYAAENFEVARLTSNEGILKFNYISNKSKKIPVEINITINGMTRIK